jgi:NAD(P)H-dependent flavin oxidoreductase YrpB (nitropropane dioxygenase family)
MQAVWAWCQATSNVEPPQGVGAVGVNFLLPWGEDLTAIEAAARTSRVVELFYATPSQRVVDAVHRGKALACWQVGSVEEARAAAEVGCDLVVAQGTEAGGHIRGSERLADLLPAVLGAVNVPVLAAGAITTAEGVRDLVRLGADAVRVGTRFVATFEAGAHPEYVRRLIAATGPEDTVLTTHFDAGWPNAPHRVLLSALEAARLRDWHGVSPPSAAATGAVDSMALYAGEGVGAVQRVEPASAVVNDLMRLL